MSWNNVKHTILFKYKSPKTMTEASFQNSLLAIVNFAELYHISSEDAEHSCWSNLCEIIVKANKAIAKRNVGDLEELFHLAATKTNGELRVILRPESQMVISAVQTDHQLVLAVEPFRAELLKNKLRHRYKLALVTYD